MAIWTVSFVATNSNKDAPAVTAASTRAKQNQTGSDVWKLTTKEGNGTCQEGCEANIQGSVHQTGREAVGNVVLDKTALDHVQHRHCVDLQQAELMIRHAAIQQASTDTIAEKAKLGVLCSATTQ